MIERECRHHHVLLQHPKNLLKDLILYLKMQVPR